MVSCVPPASPRPAMLDASAIALEPRPCIPALRQLDTDLESDFGMEFDDVVDAFKAAIEEKVDVISISLGFGIPEVTSPYHLDAVAVGSFLAMEANILTVAACGNKGPRNGTVRNTAPWILTVGASDSEKKKNYDYCGHRRKRI